MRFQTTFRPEATRRLAALVLAIVGVTLGTARASAQGTVLYGCYVPNSGTVYRIKADGLPDACRSPQHVQFTWSLQGPAGPAGPAGPIGPQGPAGPAGGLPITGVIVELVDSPPIAPGQQGGVLVSCPAGHVATGGGGEASAGQGVLLRLVQSSPRRTNGIVNGWESRFENASTVATPGRAYVVCAPAQ